MQAERDFHLREAAFSSDAEMRSQHRGVVRWLEEWLSGATEARYSLQARERLGMPLVDGVPEDPNDGSPWMESDGTEGEVRA